MTKRFKLFSLLLLLPVLVACQNVSSNSLFSSSSCISGELDSHSSSSSDNQMTSSTHNHIFSDWVVEKEPTCSEAGIKKRECNICNYQETDEIQPLGHNYSDEWTIDLEPTCNKEGSKSHHCLRCDDKTDITAISKLDHTPGIPIKENNKDTSCKEEGSYDLVTYCTVCGETIETKHVDVGLAAHKLSNATFTWDGYDSCYFSATCSVCHEVFLIKAEIQKILAIEPSCNKKGRENYIASVVINGQKYSDLKSKELEALEHQFGEWIVIQEPSERFNRDGLMRRECSICHKIEEEVIPVSSPFVFAKYTDDKAYAIIGFNVRTINDKSFSIIEGNKSIVFPETYAGLPVVAVLIHRTPSAITGPIYSDKREGSVNFYIPRSISMVDLGALRCGDPWSEEGEFEYKSCNFYYDGDFTDYLKNVHYISVQNGEANHLYLKDKEDDTYHLFDSDVVVLPEGIEEIYASLRNLAFSKLICPSSLKRINAGAFRNLRELKEVVFNEGLEEIGSEAFTNTGLKEVIIPSTVKTKNVLYCFTHCDYLLSMIAYSECIPANAFISNECQHLTKLISYCNGEPVKHTFADINAENESKCDIFTYANFNFAKIENNFYLINYIGDGIDITLPDFIEYKNKRIENYSIRKLAFASDFIDWRMPNNPSEIEYAINHLDLIDGTPLRNITMPASILSIDIRAFDNNWLKNVYFKGTLDQLTNLVQNSFISVTNPHYSGILERKSDLANIVDNIIYVLDESGEYIPVNLNSIPLD